MKKQKDNTNYLDKTPRVRDGLSWSMDEEKNVTLLLENKGLFNRIAQKFFHKPKVSQVHLTGVGNFVWPLIDGEKTVYDIACLVSEEFGEEAEPLYPRLVQYMQTLESYDFIILSSLTKEDFESDTEEE